MRRVVVSVHESKPGMKMAETIFNEYGAVIVSENTILDSHIIKKLGNLDIQRIKIYDEEHNVIIANSSEIFNAQYNENLEVIKDVLHDISVGKNVDASKVENVSESIFVRINENRDIVSCLTQIRGVDEYTYTHSVNVSLVSMLIGKWMRLSEEKIKLLIQAGLLHDIGKSKISQEILCKPGSLTKEEYEEMKKHPVFGYKILEEMGGISKDVLMAVLMHHEREDGSGYPVGAKGDQIHELAKVIAVADIYDAMTSNRIYKEKESPFDVFEIMENQCFGYLDPRVTNAFLTNIASYYIGDIVRLNTGELGEVVYINPRNVAKPLIKVGEEYLDLSKKHGARIVELI